MSNRNGLNPWIVGEGFSGAHMRIDSFRASIVNCRKLNSDGGVIVGVNLKLLAGVFALTWALAGCQATTGRTVGQNIDDANLTAAVKAQLARDKISSLIRIDVDSTDGMVELSGTVGSAEQSAHVEKLARGVSGVKNVVNKLQVRARPAS